MKNRLKYKAWEYKAWDKVNKTISNVKSIRNLNYDDDDIYKYVLTDDYENGFKNWKNIELMQCTGAKDINDNLIYEGFIVKEGDSWIKVVEYDEQYAGYGLDTKAYSYEILGNIYENPELINLKDNKND